jgi:uncharacterized protein
MSSRTVSSSGGGVTVSRLPVGSLAGFPVEIPVLTIGSGKPKISVICGLHGDEPLGIVASQLLLRRLGENENVNGTIQVIATANPPALAQGLRVSSSDFLDLNRIGPGNEKGSLTERIAAKVVGAVQDSDLIIDLHEFEMDTPPLAVFVCGTGWGETQDRILSAIRCFSPDLVWSIRYSDSCELRYAESLIAATTRSGIASFAIEVPRLGGQDSIDRIVGGILQIASAAGIIEGGLSVRPREICAFHRRVVTANVSGLWEPFQEVSLGREVEGKTVMGTVSSLGFKEVEEYHAKGGILMQLLSRKMVNTGDHLFSVGELDEDVTQKLRQSVAGEVPDLDLSS